MSKLVIFLGFPLIFLFITGSFPLEKSFEGVCSKVLDGDTVIVAGKKVRLFGIDAPELHQMSYDKKPIGKWSKDYLVKLILNKKVKVTWIKKGHYKRIIGTIYLKENINLKMIQAGMAIKSDFNTDHLFQNIEYVAKLRRVGVFGTFGFDKPWYFRKKKAATKSGL